MLTVSVIESDLQSLLNDHAEDFPQAVFQKYSLSTDDSSADGPLAWIALETLVSAYRANKLSSANDAYFSTTLQIAANQVYAVKNNIATHSLNTVQALAELSFDNDTDEFDELVERLVSCRFRRVFPGNRFVVVY